MQKTKHSSLSRIYKHHQEHQTGTISAFRDRANLKTNLANNKKLQLNLEANGYGLTSIKGVGQEEGKAVEEISFFVVDLKDKKNLKKTLISLGTQFGQDSITFAEPKEPYNLISTNKEPEGTGQGKIGVEIKLGKPKFGEGGDFFSKVRGRPFNFSVASSFKVIDNIQQQQAKRLWAKQSTEKIANTFFSFVPQKAVKLLDITESQRDRILYGDSVASLEVPKNLKKDVPVQVGVIKDLKYASNKPSEDLPVIVTYLGDNIVEVIVERPDGNHTHKESLYEKDLPNFLKHLDAQLRRR